MRIINPQNNHPLLIDSILKSLDTRAQSVLVIIVAFLDRDISKRVKTSSPHFET